LQVRQRADRIQAHKTAMIEDLLKLGLGFRIPALGHQSFATHIGRVQPAKIETEVEAVRRKLILSSDLELLQAVRSLAAPECG
jgi:hypothetical protein